ncbi:MAG: hypothetical protein ACRELF_04710, partial [Gemmataceae bacterium]
LCSNSLFRCVLSKVDLVRYESPLVYFEVGYSVSHDHEVYARVGRLATPGVFPGRSEERLDFGLLLAVADPGGDAAIRNDVPYSIAHSEGQVRRVLSHYAAGLKRYGLPLLAGDERAYALAREVRWWQAPDVPPEALQASE